VSLSFEVNVSVDVTIVDTFTLSKARSDKLTPLNVGLSLEPKPREALAVAPLSTVHAEPLETIKAPSA
jgi:hypothetical protein